MDPDKRFFMNLDPAKEMQSTDVSDLQLFIIIDIYKARTNIKALYSTVLYTVSKRHE